MSNPRINLVIIEEISLMRSGLRQLLQKDPSVKGVKPYHSLNFRFVLSFQYA